MSATARKRKEEVAQALKKLILSKGKTPAMKYQQLFDDLRGQSEAVSVFPERMLVNASARRVVNMNMYVNCDVVFLFFIKSLTCCLLLQAITKDMFEEALRALTDEDFLTVTGKTVRLL